MPLELILANGLPRAPVGDTVCSSSPSLLVRLRVQTCASAIIRAQIYESFTRQRFTAFVVKVDKVSGVDSVVDVGMRGEEEARPAHVDSFQASAENWFLQSPHTHLHPA